MSDSKVLFEFKADISNIQQALTKIKVGLKEIEEGTEGVVGGLGKPGPIAKKSNEMVVDSSNQAMTAVTGLNWAISDSPYLFQNMRMGIMAVSNNITPLVQNIVYLQKSTGSLKNALKAMGAVFTGPMGVVFAITTVVAIIQTLSIIMAKNKEKTEGSSAANKEYAKSLEEIRKSSNLGSLMSQIKESETYSKVLNYQKKQYEEYVEIINEHNRQTKRNTGLRTAQNFVDSQGLEISRQYLLITKEYGRLYDENAKKNKPDHENMLAYYEGQILSINTIITKESNKRIEINKQIEAVKELKIESREEANYKEKALEFSISKLKIDKQLAEWEKIKTETIAAATEEEKETAEYKDKILDLDMKIYKLEEQLLEEQEKITKAAYESKVAYEKIKEAYDLFIQGIDTSSDEYLQRQIDRIQTEIEATEAGTKERMLLEAQLDDIRVKLVKNQMDRAKSLIDEEIEYERRLAGVIADGGLESVYEQMFSRIKQQFLQFWLDRLGITRAMMNMENAIVLIGQGKLDAAKEVFHQRDLTRSAEEAAAAGAAAGAKGTASAAGLPFPANIAAIGIVLASVFAALRKSKISGQQIMGAAEGAFINKPTLLLAGEAMNRSGAEIVMPEKNFSKYMDQKILPGIMAKVNVNNKGVESRLERVESAIDRLGSILPNATGKAVKRALKGKF